MFVFFSVVLAEPTPGPEECPFPGLHSAWARLVGDLDDYLHSLEIDEKSHRWENFLRRVREKILPKRAFPAVLPPKELIDYCWDFDLWDYLNCDLFIFMVDELLKKGNHFPARNDLTQEKGKKLLEDKSAYIKKYEEDVYKMLERNEDQNNITTPPAGCLTAQIKCNDYEFTLNRLIQLKRFLIEVIGVNEVRFNGIRKGCIEFFFFMVPKYAADVEALRAALSVSNARLSKACNQLGIVEFHVFVPEPQVVSRKCMILFSILSCICPCVQCRYCRYIFVYNLSGSLVCSKCTQPTCVLQ